MTAKKKTAEEEFDAAPDAEAEFDAADPLLPQEAVAPEVMADRKSRLVDYIRSRPAAIADTARNLVSEDGKVAPSFANGRFGGTLPYLSAAIDTAPAVARKLAGNQEDIGATYDRNLARIKPLYEAAEKAEPAANVVGALSFPNPLGNATRGARMAGAGLQSGLESATHGGDGLTGMAAGGGVQALAEGASPLAKYFGGGMRNLAGRSAVNAAGLRGGIVNQAKRAGIPTLDALGREEIPALGNEMLDAGLIPFMGSKEAILKRSNAMMDQAGTAAAASRARGDMAGRFSQAEGIQAAESRLAQRIDPSKGGNLQTARAAGRAQDFIQDAAKTPDTFEAADALKRGAYGNTNWSTEAPDASKLKRATVSGYRQSMEDQLERLVPGEGAALRKSNQRYGLAAKTADFAEEAAGRESANRKLGATELALGALGFSGGAQAGGMLGGGVAGVALPAAAHFAKTRGAATVAPLARLGSKAAMAAGAVNQSPAASSVVGSALENYLMTDDERDKEAIPWLLEN